MNPRPFPWRPWVLCGLSGPAVLLLGWMAAWKPAWVEALYARRLYPVLAQALTDLQRWLPFSGMEVLLYGAMGALLLWAGLGWRRDAPFWPQVGRGALRLAGLLSLAVTAGMVLWGFLYRREPFAAQTGWVLKPSAEAELVELVQKLRVRLVELDAHMPRRADGTLSLEEPWELLATAGEGYRRLPAHWTVHHSDGARPKRLIWPGLLSVTLTTGVFAPWTGEAHVNGEVPACSLPFTACHELAHQKGFAREDEANFLGWAAALAHPDLRFQYSGTLAAFQEASSRLSGPLRTEALRGLPFGVRADWQAERAFYQRHATRVAQASQAFYSGYLRSQGIRDGLRSYGRFLDIMLARQRAEEDNRSTCLPSP